MNDFIINQLAVWPEANARYQALAEVERRPFSLGDFHGTFQYNPRRLGSTAAKIDADSLSARPCFLCAENRPEQQLSVPLGSGWQLLLNPFPIFPVHFTIASVSHSPQDKPPLEIGAFAERLPDLVIFFNGSRAGASAPDHLHLQAVLRCELPIVRLAESNHPVSLPGIMRSDMWGLRLPFVFLSAVITDDEEGSADYLRMLALTGAGADGAPDKGLRNLFCWRDEASGLLRMVVVPRSAHRPPCYGEGPGQFLVSPGAVDMAGVVILPRRADFDAITPEILASVYSSVTT